MYQATTALKRIRGTKKRLKIIQGGSSAGKTIATLLIFIDRAQRRSGLLSSVVSETMPHLKRGAIRDFINIMEAHGYYDESRWNRTDFTYTFETGSKIEFFSADSPDKVRGPRRNGDLFINECNNVSYETYTQLAIRTQGDVFLDYNPVAEFWVHYEIINKGVDHDFLILTYKDNEGLPKVIVDELESRRGNKQFALVYLDGLLGEAEGRIFTGWNTDLETIPHEARLERYGLDFGYSNDPSAIVAVYYLNGGYILDEIAFQKGLSNKQIADILDNHKKALVIADSAEPKSIDEIRSYGVTILPCEKGPGSVLQRIQMLQDQQVSVTKRSVNIIKEYRNYLWERDKDGRILNVPEHLWSHSMDAACYAVASLAPVKRRQEFLQNWPQVQRRKGVDNPAL